ncbi:MAG: polyphosphate kinase 1 [Chloroflexi bacterium]|nr:polyphosphate kinase 1 [Chloroflexota bacterium]
MTTHDLQRTEEGVQAGDTAVSSPPPTPTANNPEAPQQPLSIPWAVRPQEVPENASLKHPSLYFNQELGWIDFNWRVLHLALDERVPLLERVKFVAITASNLDEFIQKRVGALKQLDAAGVRTLSADGRTPNQQLILLRQAIITMHRTMTETWEQVLKPALRQQAGIVIQDYADLSGRQKEKLAAYFHAEIHPILTPLAVDPGHPFPFISNLSLSLAVILRNPAQDTIHFARLKSPPQRWIHVPADPPHTQPNCQYFLPVEQLIAHHAGDLFPSMEIVNVHPFRITRNADLLRDEEEADDLLKMISAELRQRRFASVVRLEVDHDMPDYNRRLLIRELNLQNEDVYEVNGLINLTDCFAIAAINKPAFRDEPWEPVTPSRLLRENESKNSKDIFAIIRKGDLLVHHPYESFTASVQRLVEEAAVDPQVLAIKLTLYRTSDESPIVAALKRAAENGKQVAVLVEVKARFDEANNIEWAQQLETTGVHVTYGLVGLKTHTKATLVVRQEQDGLRIYSHIGTGNYHPKTARLYTDLGLLTCDPAIGRDMVNLFHFLTGYAPGQQYERLLLAPRYMRQAFTDLIQQEIDNVARFGNGRIIAKMNALDDVKMIRELYAAAQAGVQIDLILRGHCQLRPGLPGYSENIRVISILGRFLEHDRVFYFHNNGAPRLYVGSADWRARNLNDRVELITPIEEPALQQRLVALLEMALSDNYLAWDLHADGRYTLRHPAPDEPERNFHELLMKQARKRSKKEKNKRY